MMFNDIDLTLREKDHRLRYSNYVDNCILYVTVKTDWPDAYFHYYLNWFVSGLLL